MESLERRTLLTTVTTLLDTVNDGTPTSGTLRWAIGYYEFYLLIDTPGGASGPSAYLTIYLTVE